MQIIKKWNKLYLENNTNITNEGLRWLQGVHTLDLWSNTNVTNEGLKWLQGVHTLNLWSNTKITNEGLRWLVSYEISRYQQEFVDIRP